MQVADFDTMAAVECAQLTGAALKTGKKRGGAGNEPWQKVKIDRQIVAIAKVHQVQIVYTCDGGLASTARSEAFEVVHVADLPMPRSKTKPNCSRIDTQLLLLFWALDSEAVECAQSGTVRGKKGLDC
jgi:hypothetical protein